MNIRANVFSSIKLRTLDDIVLITIIYEPPTTKEPVDWIYRPDIQFDFRFYFVRCDGKAAWG